MKVYYRITITVTFIILFILMLTRPGESLYYGFTGLTLWFQKMIPTLFPFMILSGIMIRMNLTESISSVLKPILGPLFHVSANGVYCIVMGFLCGFPMGAKVIADLYEREKLSQEEAQYLLSFCNNIGPIYFVSFVLPLLGLKKTLPYLVGMYGIPLMYGNILRRIKYRGDFKVVKNYCLKAASKEHNTLLYYVDDSIMSSIESITRLGGYMILFNLLNLLPTLLLPSACLPIINGILEITSGISRMGNSHPLLTLVLLSFGGLSCLAQTYSIIKNTNLSFKSYTCHKLILTGITSIYYFAWYLISSSSFSPFFLS